ncbi:hypothetical protein SAMN02745126_03050 [Enhydrobacter aerosaccus]|uniref:Uncharacterized protein n=1 Tax=Enhydrobacter aerosaccus TaxID=225324 RepID=A0A1T4PWD3_9HYPH|nr:hypothetical protein [Enhydrobacter aerosaccus]SJZ95805.1 hypothetical protein SAMN02745126_03050 [Enhydrobacter aerosaccus]
MAVPADRLLRRTLRFNAVFSVLSGAIMVGLAGPLAQAAADGPVSIAGLDLPIVIELLGLEVAAFGALCAWIASRPIAPLAWARLVLAADVGWVAGSVIVLLLPAAWTTAGIVGIVVPALIVADLAVLEFLGLRRIKTAN